MVKAVRIKNDVEDVLAAAWSESNEESGYTRAVVILEGPNMMPLSFSSGYSFEELTKTLQFQALNVYIGALDE